jgi:UDP:flavonoid glycosyltransferase YjiC (YdhE family)
MNSILESVYHATPIVGIPLVGDEVKPFSSNGWIIYPIAFIVVLQFDNVYKLVSRGLGVALDRDTFTSEQLAQEIIHVFNDSGLVI